MLQVQEPRLITEKEDVHLIEAFLIGTKPNEAGWAISKNPKTPIQSWVGKDFVMIPEKIFDPNQLQPGHSTGDTIDEDWEEIKQHSHGKIVKVKGPYPYEDGSDDYYYNAVVKLNDRLSASALVENGNKTLKPFAVSPQIIRHGSTRDNVIDYTPMGLFLVIKGAYGDQSVVNKMCSGSELKCGTKLSAAIHNLNHDTNDAHLAEVLTSYISATANKTIMSAQTPEVVQTPVPHYVKPEIVQQPVSVGQPVELNKDETIKLTKEEYDKIEAERKSNEELKIKVAELEKQRNETIINQIFGSIEDAEVKTKIFEKYINKDVSLLKSAYDDFNTHILPKAIEAKLAESKNDNKKEQASVLKREPRIVKDETLAASIETDDISISECRSILGL